MSPRPSDADLLRLIASADREAFAALRRRYGDLVFRFVFQMSGSTIIAQDVTQVADHVDGLSMLVTP